MGEPVRWWDMRPAQGSQPKTYTCPICHGRLLAMNPNTLLSPEGDRERRRHAHTECVAKQRAAGKLLTKREWERLNKPPRAARAWDKASDEPPTYDAIAEGLRQHPAKKGAVFNVLVTVVEVGGSIGLFHLAQRAGASDVASYLIGSIAPVLGGLLVWMKARSFSGASAAIFAFTALSAVIALIGSTTPKVLLYKDCAVTALIGLIFLGSCVLARKPLVFSMAQRYGTDGTHDGMAVFRALWDVSPDFRACMYLLSYLWAGLFLVQAAATALIIHQSSYSTGYNYDQILPFVAIGLGIVGSLGFSRYFMRKGQARGAASA